MKPMTDNPRRISKKAAERLRADLERFGDLSGVVHDLNSDTTAGGHQRLRVLFGEQAGAFKVTEADIEIAKQLDAPDAQGTVAHGFILWRGFRYAYRQVRWDDATLHAANVKANLDGGQWDWDALAGWDAEALRDWGFDSDALAEWNEDANNLREMLSAETPNFEPVGIEEQGRLDQKAPVTCPHCGMEFIPK